MRGWPTILLLLAATTSVQADGLKRSERAWAKHLDPGQTASARRVREGSARGLRAELLGATVTRLAFRSEAAARAYAEKDPTEPSLRVLELRGRQVVVLTGAALEDVTSARTLFANAWQTLRGGDREQHLLLVTKGKQSVAGLVYTPEGRYQDLLDDGVAEATARRSDDDALLSGCWAVASPSEPALYREWSPERPGLVARSSSVVQLQRNVRLLEGILGDSLGVDAALDHLEATAPATASERDSARSEKRGGGLSLGISSKKGRRIGGAAKAGRINLSGTWLTSTGKRIVFSNRRSGPKLDVYDIAEPFRAVELEALFNGLQFSTRQPSGRAPMPTTKRRRGGLLGGVKPVLSVIKGGDYRLIREKGRTLLRALDASTSPYEIVRTPELDG